eukprot:scaffold68372_cov64-Phaeocystis_antarctica.AAC.3
MAAGRCGRAISRGMPHPRARSRASSRCQTLQPRPPLLKSRSEAASTGGPGSLQGRHPLWDARHDRAQSPLGCGSAPASCACTTREASRSSRGPSSRRRSPGDRGPGRQGPYRWVRTPWPAPKQRAAGCRARCC